MHLVRKKATNAQISIEGSMFDIILRDRKWLTYITEQIKR